MAITLTAHFSAVSSSAEATPLTTENMFGYFDPAKIVLDNENI